MENVVGTTVVFRPSVQSRVTLNDELNTFEVCHRSLWRSNRVTFCPKKETVQKKISASRHQLIREHTDQIIHKFAFNLFVEMPD